MSYPVSELKKAVVDTGKPTEFHLFVALQQLEQMVGRIAADAIRLGLMIRGGAATGPLYHFDGVVLGKAMVDAYDLESKVAIYPRIAVSKSIYEAMKEFHGFRIRLDDRDGIAYLDYFGSMILKSGASPGPDMKVNIKLWLDLAHQQIATHIDAFMAAGKWNQYAKWIWFRNELERAYAALPPGLLP